MFFKRKDYSEYLIPAGEAWEFTSCPLSKKELKIELRFISRLIKEEARKGSTNCDLMFENPKVRDFIRKILMQKGYKITSEWEYSATYKMNVSWRILENAD